MPDDGTAALAAADPGISRRYQRHVAPFARPFATQLVAAIGHLEGPAPVIDHGAGTGLVTKLLRSRARGVPIIAVDPSAGLMRGLGAIEGVTAILGTAGDLPGGLGAQAVVSNLALVFCPDPVADLVSLRRACRPGARLAVTALGRADEVGPFHCFWEVANDLIPGAWAPGRYPHHGLGDAGALARVAAEAGWHAIEEQAVVGVRRISAPGAWRWLSSALPVGVDSLVDGSVQRYGPLQRSERPDVRAEFLRRWDADPSAARTIARLLLARA
jgi:SAM-dependent methyltransferase